MQRLWHPSRAQDRPFGRQGGWAALRLLSAVLSCGLALWAAIAALPGPSLAVSPSPGAVFSVGEPRTIALPPLAHGADADADTAPAGVVPADGLSGPAPAVRVLHPGGDELDLEFLLPAMTVLDTEIDGGTYQALEIPGGAITEDAAGALLPSFTRLIAVPDHQGVVVEVRECATTERSGIRPLPAAALSEGGFSRLRVAGTATEAPRVTTGAPALLRGLRVVPITFHPVRYDSARDLLEVAHRMRVSVHFEGEDPRHPAGRGPVPSASFDRIYRKLVVNYDGAREGETNSLGSYVIICPDDDALVAALQPLVEWRTRKGYDVYLATTAETGESAEEIQAWLRAAYLTWENPPEYITLIGDAEGSVFLPCWFEESPYSGETDHPYVQLDGDFMADAHIGRISVDSVDRLALYVTKIVGYESTPYMEETDWYSRACVVGDPSESGYTCVQVMQWLKSRLLEQGYAEVDTVFTGPWASQMVMHLNKGDTVFSYRGFYGMSGFQPGHILNLENGWKMPYAVNSTCETGSFAHGLAINEAWIRAGLPPSTPTGGIASIATATGGTHTRYNNCMVYGAWRAPFWEGLYHFGESLTRAKLELYINYGEYDPVQMERFCQWNNLMGDPAGELWTGIPQPLEVDHPALIGLGANQFTVAVTTDGAPCAGAYVCLWKGDELHIGEWTDAGGSAQLPLADLTAGELLVTVTKHDHHPYLGAAAVAPAENLVAYRAHLVDDDTIGSSLGNGDGLANPTERLELPVEIENFGQQTVTGVIGTLSSDDPRVLVIDGEESFGDLEPGATAWSADDFDVEIGPGLDHGEMVYLRLDLSGDRDLWRSVVPIPIVSARFRYLDHTLYGFGGGIDPGESGEITLRIINQGGSEATDVSGILVSGSHWVTVTDAEGDFGTIAVGGQGENIADPFALTVDPECFRGHRAALSLQLEFSGGARDTVTCLVAVGEATGSDPTGPDAYGYYAIGSTDADYALAPAYAWVEINPELGGSGESVGLTDFGWEEDDSRTVELPFPFKYYGETYQRVTICSNGWIAMGSTYLTNYRNWSVPGGGSPPAMIAPMWDNLYQVYEQQVYHWYDSANHRYIVEWSDVRNHGGGGDSEEDFQVILHNPAHYWTETGDGIILFQYQDFNNLDYAQHRSTIGIENRDCTIGILYGYFNDWTLGSAPITDGTAIKLLPLANEPRGYLTGTVSNVTNGGTPLPLASIELLDQDTAMLSGPDGIYGGGVPVGVHTITVDHPSFAADTVAAVTIAEDQIRTLDFALEDIAPPLFSETAVLDNTIDTVGVYEVTTRIEEYSALVEPTLVYNVAGSGWVAVPLQSAGDDRYQAAIPAQDYTTLVCYYLRAEDAGGLMATMPANAPAESYCFWVMPPALADECEAGPGGWTHEAVTEGYVDQWHLTDNRNHTPGGAWSWRYGEEGQDEYAPYADGVLISEPFAISGGATLSLWHWMDAEYSEMYPGYAYDGGLVEMSVDGSPWEVITPDGGYTHLVRARWQGPGPFPAETPFWSGEFDWREDRFTIAGTFENVQVRFRFGSDYAAQMEGWYLDDVLIVSHEPGASDVDDILQIPRRLQLSPCAPNPVDPLRASSLVSFGLPQPAAVRLQIVDLNGRLVRHLVDDALPAGEHRLVWDGRDARGQIVSSGVYFLVLQAAGSQYAQRVMIVR